MLRFTLPTVFDCIFLSTIITNLLYKVIMQDWNWMTWKDFVNIADFFPLREKYIALENAVTYTTGIY